MIDFILGKTYKVHFKEGIKLFTLKSITNMVAGEFTNFKDPGDVRFWNFEAFTKVFKVELVSEKEFEKMKEEQEKILRLWLKEQERKEQLRLKQKMVAEAERNHKSFERYEKPLDKYEGYEGFDGALNWLAKNGEIYVSMPEHASELFHAKYEYYTGEKCSAKAHSNPNTYTYNLHIKFPRNVPDEVKRILEHTMSPATPSGANHLEINNNKEVWNLIRLGFRYGRNHKYEG
jgi:hypothetical protein